MILSTYIIDFKSLINNNNNNNNNILNSNNKIK